jgi:hypothetical protein
MMREIHSCSLSFGLAFCAALLAPVLLGAQARPDGLERPWIELALGGSTMAPNCGACAQRSRIGGPSLTLAAGVTVNPDFGIGLLGREFATLSYDYTHSASYLLAVGQYSPQWGRSVTLDFGFGVGHQQGDNPPYGDNGTGAVLDLGVTLRGPARGIFGLTLNADVLESVSGSLTTLPNQTGSAYHPTLITIGVGLSLAGSEAPR